MFNFGFVPRASGTLEERMSSWLWKWKEGRELANPGPFERLHQDTRNVCLTQQFFEGGKADLAKGLSANFQVTHAFTMTNSMMMPPTYHFGAIYVAGKHLMHGLIDTNGIFQGKYHFNPSKALSLRAQAQIQPSSPNQAGQSVLQLESEYSGPDYVLNARAINPDPATGVFISTASWMQSITKNLALGAEAIAQRMGPKEPVEFGSTLAAKYATPQYTAGLSLQQMTAMQATYFHRVSPQVELGSELQVLLAGPRSDSVCTIAAKFDYKQALVRAQLDSTGKVALLFEEKLYPGFSLLLAGEIDHAKASSRFGIGLNIES